MAAGRLSDFRTAFTWLILGALPAGGSAGTPPDAPPPAVSAPPQAVRPARTLQEAEARAARHATTPLAQLGFRIFFDPALSASGRMSCATCHDPRYAYGPTPGHAIAVGGPHLDHQGTRTVPSLRYLRGVPKFQVEYHFADGDTGPGGGLMWDGRAAGFEQQALLPLLDPDEMANPGLDAIARKLAAAPYAAQLRAQFGAGVFDDPRQAVAAATRALAAFQQVPEEFFPYSSRYDAYQRGDIDFTEQEERGTALFKDPAKGNCASCHLGVAADGVPPPFTDFDFVNVGVPRNPRLRANADPHHYDLGLCGPKRKGLEDHRELCGMFRSPTVRNSASRDAFFHNGVFGDLRRVLEFYNERDLHPEKFYSRDARGGVRRYDDLPAGLPDDIDHDPPLDRKPGEQPALTDQDIDDIIAFIRTLTDADVVNAKAAGSTVAAADAPP